MSGRADRPQPHRRLLPAFAALLLAPLAAPANGCRSDRAAPAPRAASADAPSAPTASVTTNDPDHAPGDARALDLAAAPTPPAGTPGVPAALPPPPAALAAHLARIPEGPGMHLVARLELHGLVGREELRVAARLMLDRLGTDGENACLVELLSSVSAVTYVWQESEGPDAGLALVDAAVGLPAVLPCLHSLDWPVPVAVGATDDGLLALAPQISAAAAGDATVAVGATDLVRAAHAGSPPRPLSQSTALDRVRALVGASPAWAAWFEPDGSTPTASTVHGGIGLHTEPRLGLTGALTFADTARAGALVAQAGEVLAGLHRAGQPVLQEAARRLTAEDLTPLRTVLDTARDTRFVVDAGTLTFEAWFPPGFTVPELLGALVALEPILDLL